jgi:sugar phosphate isomerase/epimerase
VKEPSHQPERTSPCPFDRESIGICLETLLVDPMRGYGKTEFERMAQATSQAGFRSVAMWSWPARDLGADYVRRFLDDLGLRVRLTECGVKWAQGPAAAVDHLEEQLDLVEAVGSNRMLAISKDTSMDLSRAAAGFAAVCDRAAERGLHVTIEFIPCRAVPDLATAWRIVRQSGAANGGLDIDMMHWQHQPGGPDLDLLRSIPGRHVHYVQACDAFYPTPPLDDYIATAVTARPLPGDGVVDIPAIVAALSEIGADPFFAMEVFNTKLAAEGPEIMAAQVRAAADSLFP